MLFKYRYRPFSILCNQSISVFSFDFLFQLIDERTFHIHTREHCGSDCFLLNIRRTTENRQSSWNPNISSVVWYVLCIYFKKNQMFNEHIHRTVLFSLLFLYRVLFSICLRFFFYFLHLDRFCRDEQFVSCLLLLLLLNLIDTFFLLLFERLWSSFFFSYFQFLYPRRNLN